MKSSVHYDYATMACMHRLAIDILKIDRFFVEPAIIQRTGNHSLSFQTAIVLLEESIIREIGPDAGKMKGPVKKLGNNKAVSQIASQSSDYSKINLANRDYWFNLINIYEHLGNEDAL